MKLLILALCLLVQSAFAQTLDGYHQRFKLVKNEDGSVKAVTMKLMSKGFSIKPYLNQIKEDVKAEIKRLRNTGFVDTELDQFEAELAKNYTMNTNGFTSDPDAPRISREAVANLKNIDIDQAFKELGNAGVFNELQNKLKDALFVLRLDVVSTLDDPKYFFKKNVSYEVVSRLLKFAQKRLGDVPVLNLASFIIVRVHDLVLEQRTFHQNMLMHYLDNFDEKDLGLTAGEVDRAYSSIFESRLSPINYLEYKNIEKKWANYGIDKFFAMVRLANTKARTFDKSTSEKISYGFIKVNSEKNAIYHLLINSHMFSQKPSLAYDFDNPKKVKRFRSLLNLAQIGLGFLPINGSIKGMVDNFIESFYVEQKKSEGALAAYFESMGDEEFAKNFFAQTINPYLIFR